MKQTAAERDLYPPLRGGGNGGREPGVDAPADFAKR